MSKTIADPSNGKGKAKTITAIIGSFLGYGFISYIQAFLVTCLIGVILLGVAIYNGYYVLSYKQINHFEDISECEFLNEYKLENKTLKDRYIKDIEYTDSFVCKCEYEGIRFDFYAYECEDAQGAAEYIARGTGKKVMPELETNFLSSSNLVFSSSLIAVYGNNVYRLETGDGKDYVEIKKLLNSHFDVQLCE